MRACVRVRVFECVCVRVCVRALACIILMNKTGIAADYNAVIRYPFHIGFMRHSQFSTGAVITFSSKHVHITASA